MTVQWQYGAVAFLDILGFSHFVESDAKAASPHYLDNLISCLAEARSNTPVTELDLRSFSDSIVLSAPLVPDAVVKLVLSVVGLQRIFTRRSVLVRGGIAMGKHFADQDSIYSEALVRAYRLEHEHARFPRIIYDIDLLDWFMNDEACSQESKAKVAELLLRDRDGKIFSHYLCPDLIAVHADLISSYQSQKVTASVLEKVQWLASYHNHAAASIPNAAHVGGPLIDGFAVVQPPMY